GGPRARARSEPHAPAGGDQAARGARADPAAAEPHPARGAAPERGTGRACPPARIHRGAGGSRAHAQGGNRRRRHHRAARYPAGDRRRRDPDGGGGPDRPDLPSRHRLSCPARRACRPAACGADPYRTAAGAGALPADQCTGQATAHPSLRRALQDHRGHRVRRSGCRRGRDAQSHPGGPAGLHHQPRGGRRHPRPTSPGIARKGTDAMMNQTYVFQTEVVESKQWIDRITLHNIRGVPITPPPYRDRPKTEGALLLEVETNDGVIGYATSGYAHHAAIHLMTEWVAPRILEAKADPFRTDYIASLFDRHTWERALGRMFTIVLSMVDIACWDIKGKTLGKPIHHLLGGARDRVPVYVTHGAAYEGAPPYSREELAAEAKFLADK